MVPPTQNQSLTEHLAELRIRIIYIILILLCGSGLSFYFSETLFELLRSPVAPHLPQGGLVYTGIMDKFVAHIKVSILGGVILTSPLWLYQIWQFVAPGLYKKEKKYAILFLSSGTALFLSGVAFCYYVVYPMAFDWLFAFGGTTDVPMITIDEYLSFFVVTLLLFGVSFELPLVLVFLGMLGVVDQKFLREKRRYAIVILAVVSALLTPPDVLSQTFMLIPMLLLYESSIFLVGWVQKSVK